MSNQGESIRFWQTAPLAGVELLSARYIEQRFAPVSPRMYTTDS